MDLDGDIVWKPEGTDYGINAAGYVIHSAIHLARRDVNAVIHTHSTAGMSVSAMTSGLLPLTQTLVLRSHGLLACGPGIPEAFNTLYQLETSCRAQVAALVAGLDAVAPPPQDVIDLTAKVFDPKSIRPYGRLEWPAMLRKVEAETTNNGYPYYAS